MKAIRVYGPKDVKYEEVPMPEIGPDEKGHKQLPAVYETKPYDIFDRRGC